MDTDRCRETRNLYCTHLHDQGQEPHSLSSLPPSDLHHGSDLEHALLHGLEVDLEDPRDDSRVVGSSLEGSCLEILFQLHANQRNTVAYGIPSDSGFSRLFFQVSHRGLTGDRCFS